MSAIISIKKTKKELLSNEQKTFNRLTKKIRSLQKALQDHQAELDACLQFFHTRLEPEEKILAQSLRAFIKEVYKHYTNTKEYSKKQRATLQNFLRMKLDELASIEPFKKDDSEITTIVSDIEGVPYEQIVTDEFNDMKAIMAELFKKQNINLDLSEINLQDDEDEIVRKLFEATHSASHSQQETISQKQEKKKTEKQLQKEQKEKELAELQKRSINDIYKSLAKNFHPDLEQDPTLKAEKAELMKKITTAYESNDLHALLLIQIEWMNRTTLEEAPDSKLKLYNLILKDQVKDLEKSIQSISFHPRYMFIEPYIAASFYPPLITLQQVLRKHQQYKEAYDDVCQKLQGLEAKKEMLQIIIEIEAATKHRSFEDEITDFLASIPSR
jgi:hypothetical protein